MSKLNVHVFGAKQLSNASGTVKCQVFLIDGKQKSDIEQTKAVEDASNPVWEESFDFQLSDFSAGTTTLKLVVMSGKEVVGQSDIPLNNIIEDPDSYLNEKKFEYKHLFVYLSS